jgi:Tfp pilus assembly protein PilF
MKRPKFLFILFAGIIFCSLSNAQTKSELDEISHLRQQLEKHRKLAANNSDAYSYRVVETLIELGYLHIEREEFWEALPVFEEILELSSNHQTGGIHVDESTIKESLAEILEGIGNQYADSEDYNTAERYYLRSLAISEKLAKEHPTAYLLDVSRLLGNIGNIYHYRKKYRNAEKYYQRSLQIHEQLAKEQPEKSLTRLSNMSVALTNIGNNYDEREKYRRAEMYYLRSLQIREQLAKEQPDKYLPRLATLLENIGHSLIAQRKYAEAIRQYQRRLQICEQLAKEDAGAHLPLLALAYGNLSWGYLFVNESRQSETAAHRALELDATQTWVKVNLAHAMLFQNRFSEADELYRELSQIIEANQKTFTPTILDDLKVLKRENAIPKNLKSDVKKIKKQNRK